MPSYDWSIQWWCGVEKLWIALNRRKQSCTSRTVLGVFMLAIHPVGCIPFSFCARPVRAFDSAGSGVLYLR